jgi:hypothetical protein
MNSNSVFFNNPIVSSFEAQQCPLTISQEISKLASEYKPILYSEKHKVIIVDKITTKIQEYYDEISCTEMKKNCSKILLNEIMEDFSARLITSTDNKQDNQSQLKFDQIISFLLSSGAMITKKTNQNLNIYCNKLRLKKNQRDVEQAEKVRCYLQPLSPTAEIKKQIAILREEQKQIIQSQSKFMPNSI